MTDKPQQNRKPQDVSAHDIRIFAAKLRLIADGYDNAAGLLETAPAPVIKIEGKISAERGLRLVRGWKGTVADAVDELLIETRTTRGTSIGMEALDEASRGHEGGQPHQPKPPKSHKRRVK